MNLAAISGFGWTHYQDASCELLHRLASNGGTDAVLIDLEAITREADNWAAAGRLVDRDIKPTLPGYLSFATWMKDARLADDVIDANAILGTARLIPSEHLVIIDARSYSVDLIESALVKARLAWYPLENWHPTFAVIADDVYLLRLVSALARTFYSQPRVISERETRVIVKQLMRRAFVYRWFGPTVGRRIRHVAKFVSRLRSFAVKFNDFFSNAQKP